MLIAELKKIWRPVILLVAGLITVLYYFMFLDFYREHFPNGPYHEGSYLVALDMVEAYGNTLEPEEAQDFYHTITQMEQEADDYIRKSNRAQDLGITSYAQFLEEYDKAMELEYYSEENQTEEMKRYEDLKLLKNYLLDTSATGNIHGKILGAKQDMEQYESYIMEGRGFTDDSPPTPDATGILPMHLVDTTNTYMGHIAVLILLVICVVNSPVLVGDAISGVRATQWSSRRGRTVMRYQLLANLLTTVVVTTLGILNFMMLFLSYQSDAFWQSPLLSFTLSRTIQTPATYGMWVALLVVLCYGLALGVSGLIFVISHRSSNYITMLLATIVTFVVSVLLVNTIMHYPLFSVMNPLHDVVPIPYIEILAGLAFTALGIGLAVREVGQAQSGDMGV